MEIVERVRWYQAPFYRALTERTHNRLIAIWHRRAGKDEIVLKAMRRLAFEQPGTYWHCFPEQKQARKAIWDGVNPNTGTRRILEAFPERLHKRSSSTDMFIELVNGSTFQLIGSDRYDATVGSGPRGIAYSEWALSDPAAFAYHAPMLRENDGFAAFITTPRGNNHAKTMYDRAQKSPDWFCELLSIQDTGALTAEQLDEARREYIDLWGEDLGRSYFEQEYECSFSGAQVGAYFGAEINRAEREGRILELPVDPAHPVHTVWDLGKAANNPIGCFQVINRIPRWVDFYEPESHNLRDWVRWLDEQGYTGFDYVPHDIMATEWGSDKTRIDTLRSMGRRPVRIPQVAVADGLQAARDTINTSLICSPEHNPRMARWIDGCKAYRREWDSEMQIFRERPVKDWAEHIGSMTRYLGLAWREIVPSKAKREQPKDLQFEVTDDGRLRPNMDVERWVRRKERERRLARD